MPIPQPPDPGIPVGPLGKKVVEEAFPEKPHWELIGRQPPSHGGPGYLIYIDRSTNPPMRRVVPYGLTLWPSLGL